MVEVGAWRSIDCDVLFEVSFDVGIRGGAVLHGIVEGKAREGGIVSCFDGCKPGGWDWVTGEGMVESNKSADAGELIHIVGLRGSCSGGGVGRRCNCGRRDVVGKMSKRGCSR